jgi:hypothetical protein
MTCPAIDNLASCEIRAVSPFLQIKNTSAAQIHREVCSVCGQNVMSEGTVRQWRRMFKDWRTNVRGKERSVRSSVVNGDLVQSVNKIFVKDGSSKFQNFIVNFQNFTRSSYEITATRLGYHKFCWIQKILTGVHK